MRQLSSPDVRTMPHETACLEQKPADLTQDLKVPASDADFLPKL